MIHNPLELLRKDLRMFFEVGAYSKDQPRLTTSYGTRHFYGPTRTTKGYEDDDAAMRLLCDLTSFLSDDGLHDDARD